MKAVALVYLFIVPLLAMGDHPEMAASIQEVKKQHEAKFLSLPNVVAVGIGLGRDGKETIIVGLDKPNPETEAQIPAILEGYPVQVKIMGPIRIQ